MCLYEKQMKVTDLIQTNRNWIVAALVGILIGIPMYFYLHWLSKRTLQQTTSTRVAYIGSLVFLGLAALSLLIFSGNLAILVHKKNKFFHETKVSSRSMQQSGR